MTRQTGTQMPRGRTVPGSLPGTLTWKTDYAAEAGDRERYRGEDELRKLAAIRDEKRESFKLSLWAFRQAGGFLGYVSMMPTATGSRA